MFNYKRHPLSQLNWKGGSNSSSSAQTSSSTTEASTTQSGSNNISVSNGGSVVVQSQDAGIIANAFNFAGGLISPLLNTVNEQAAQEHQTAQTALANEQSTGAAATQLAGTVASNAQLGSGGILENPVFIWGVVGVAAVFAIILLNRGNK